MNKKSFTREQYLAYTWLENHSSSNLKHLIRRFCENEFEDLDALLKRAVRGHLVSENQAGIIKLEMINGTQSKRNAQNRVSIPG